MTSVDWIDRGAFREEGLLVCGVMGTVGVAVQAENSKTHDAVRNVLSEEAVKRELQQQLTENVKKRFGRKCYVGLLEFDSEELTLSAQIIASSAKFDDRDSVARRAGEMLDGVVELWDQWLASHLAEGAHYALSPEWVPVEEISDSARPALSESEAAELRVRMGRLLRRRHEARRGRAYGLVAIGGSSLALFGATALALLGDETLRWVALAIGSYALFFVGIGLFAWVSGVSHLRDASEEIQRTTDEIDLRNIDKNARDVRAEKLFLAHGSDLKRYYDQALRQAKHVYYVGVASLMMGVLIIGGALALVVTGVASTLPEQVIVGVLAAISSLLVNYIAIIYLQMFSGTVSALTGFHARLVSTHHLHFANVLTTKIEDEQLRHQALAEMAAAMSRAPLDEAPAAGLNGQPPANGNGNRPRRFLRLFRPRETASHR